MIRGRKRRIAVVVGIALMVTVVVIGVAVAVGAGMGLGAPAIAHPVEGRSACLTCHGQGTADPYPGWHAEREYDEGGCQTCHHTGG